MDQSGTVLALSSMYGGLTIPRAPRQHALKIEVSSTHKSRRETPRGEGGNGTHHCFPLCVALRREATGPPTWPPHTNNATWTSARFAARFA
jgi:hypothetical protein